MKAGFSLIEIIVATLLSAMLATVLFNAFYQSNRSLVLVDEYTEIDTNQVVVLHQFEQDLAATLWLPIEKKEEAKKGDNKQQMPAVGDAQKKEVKKITKNFFSSNKSNQLVLLTFLTLNPRALYNGKPRLVRVVYRLAPHKEYKDVFVLTRQESADLDFELFEVKGEKKIRELVVCDAVKKCSLEFVYTPTKKTDDKKPEPKKVAEWNSDAPDRAAQSVPPLPQAVIISLDVADELNKIHRVLTYRTPIYPYEQAIITDQQTQAQAAPQASNQQASAQPSAPARQPQMSPPFGPRMSPPPNPGNRMPANNSSRNIWTGNNGFIRNQ